MTSRRGVRVPPHLTLQTMLTPTSRTSAGRPERLVGSEASAAGSGPRCSAEQQSSSLPA